MFYLFGGCSIMQPLKMKRNIMEKLSMIILLIVVYACSGDHKKISDVIEIIPIDVYEPTRDASSFLEKIEIVPLETNDSSLLFRINKVIYDKDINMFAIYTSDQIVYAFTGKGQYIDNSKRMKGQGPEDYTMVLDISFNPYLKGIDLLNPYGTIYTYSPTFEFISKRQFKSEFPVDYSMALDSNNYIFNHPFVWTDQELSFVNLNTKQVVNASYEGTISGNNMSHHCFYHIDDNFYYVLNSATLL